MQIAAGRRYLVRNLRTLESSYYNLLEVYGYQGQAILYGELERHEIMLPTGRKIVVPARPTAFPVFPAGDVIAIAHLVDELKGLPLALSEAPRRVTPSGNIKAVEGPEVPVLNMTGKLEGVWDGRAWLSPGVPKCQKLVDLYLDYKRLGRLPTWFTDARTRTRIKEQLSLNGG